MNIIVKSENENIEAEASYEGSDSNNSVIVNSEDKINQENEFYEVKE